MSIGAPFVSRDDSHKKGCKKHRKVKFVTTNHNV